MKTLSAFVLAISIFGQVNLLAEDCEVPCCKAPTVVNRSQPEIPADLLKPGETAEITIRCAIDENGKLIGAKTVKTSHKNLEAPVIAAVKNWTFEACLENGEPRRATVNIPFKFTVAAK